ncbi:MAG: DEAD/DEAH box helicase family protein [Pseudanabaena sp. CAN_BIN31]|nr:DEAD/DEAH box helicase family protein [Pseudanabaena sp. CAN_BIN31]
MQTFQIEKSGTIQVSRGENPRDLYEHQNQAIQALDRKNLAPFKGLLVLPTGGGKTLTAVHWMLKNFIDKGQKVLWIAHRHELLNQALDTVKNSAYHSTVQNVKKFRYRIISGHSKHDIPVNIKSTDDIIIASKDSLNSGLIYLLENWVNHAESILLVIDEAHHASAKTYRKLIESIEKNFTDRKKSKNFKMLGLTATPFRTEEGEAGLLKKVFPDDIIFAEHLRTLINRGILAEPIFESLETQLNFYHELTDRDIKSIEGFDKIPKDVAEKIAMSNVRNKQIVDHYINNRDRYKPLLVFAIDVIHAITLNEVFRSRGVKSDFVVSSIQNAGTGATVSPQENSRKIQQFRNGELEVLINVEMLTEGTDLPNVQTVFLTRPTTSTILMTQMIGRALRGTRAGGTDKAYVVTFIDDWENKINWVNPEKLHIEEDAEFIDRDKETAKKIARLISIDKIEEFARIMDSSIDTTELEKLDFLKRIPIGIYRFSILEPYESGESVPRNYDVLLYDDTEEAYDNFINDLETIFKLIDADDREELSEGELEYLLNIVKDVYFPNNQFLIGYRDGDLTNILRFYAQKQIRPEFLAFSEKRKCNLAIVARHIYDNSLGGRAKTDYVDSLWDNERSFWRVLFGSKLYFKKQLHIETCKLEGDYGDTVSTPPVLIPDDVPLTDLTLNEIKERDPFEYRKIKDAVFAKYSADGFIWCAVSKFKSQSRNDFQIDHIQPMSQGGKTVLNNLQVLSRKAHIEKTTLENMNNH